MFLSLYSLTVNKKNCLCEGHWHRKARGIYTQDCVTGCEAPPSCSAALFLTTVFHYFHLLVFIYSLFTDLYIFSCLFSLYVTIYFFLSILLKFLHALFLSLLHIFWISLSFLSLFQKSYSASIRYLDYAASMVEEWIWTQLIGGQVTHNRKWSTRRDTCSSAIQGTKNSAWTTLG